MPALSKWLSAGLCVALVACGGRDQERDTMDTTTDATITPAPGTVGTGTTDVDAMVHSQQMVQLAAMGGSGVQGEAMFARSGERTEVTLRLMGAGRAGSHASHIHSGTCENQGPVVAPVGDVNVDATGNGSVSTTLDLPIGTIMNGQHYIQAHQSAGANSGSPVTCGNIPAHTM